jgi:uncharacterized damage-inducible protein DinB
MQIDPFVLLDYTRWANARVSEGLRQLPDDLLNTPIREGWLSPFDVLVHMVAAERLWLSRWQGESPDHLMTRDDLPTLDALSAAWDALDTETRAFLRTVDDPNRIVTYRTTKGVEHKQAIWELVMHLINHHTEHRSQVGLFLATHGVDVGNLDLIAYLRDTAGG